MTSAQRTGELRLHTGHDGQIWYMERGGEPAPAGVAPSDFASQKWVLDAELVRVFGSRENADLICALHTAQKQANRSNNVTLGNPRLIPDDPRRIKTVFGKMSHVEYAASCSGWRKLSDKDYVTYALAGVLSNSPSWSTHRDHSNLAEQFLKVHPAWPAFSFIDGVDKQAACKIIVTMLDPRWHVDPSKPDARKRLSSTFGLGQDGSKNLAHLLVGGPEHPPGRNVDLTRTVLDAWTGSSYVPPAPDKIGPREFLWRIQGKQLKTPVKAMLKACNVFLAFIQGVWLDNLTPSRVYAPATRRTGSKSASLVNYARLQPAQVYSPQLFVPEYFFEISTEVQAWKTHCEALGQRSV